MNFPCEQCAQTTTYREAYVIACSTELVSWIDARRLEGEYLHEGDDSVQGWLEHLQQKVWFRGSRLDFLAAVDRLQSHRPLPARKR